MTLVQSVGFPDARSCETLVMTSPRDGWRLTVSRDGSARVNYAALPQTLTVPSGSFDFLQLHAALATRARSMPATDGSGTVECRSAGTDRVASLPFDDDAFAARQFERAWDRTPAPSDAIDREHVDTLRQMWEKRDRPR